MEISFTDLRRLIELWAAWYSIGVDGWLASDESTHTCSLDLPDPTPSSGSVGAHPPYPPDPELDALFLRALNELGLQCSRLGSISFSRTGTGEEITNVARPIVALLENGQPFFSGKRLSIFSELRRDYGDFGSHTMALDLAVQDRQVVIHHASVEMNNRRRGLKLELWEPLTNALAAYEEIFEQGAALGHSFADHPDNMTDDDEETANASDDDAEEDAEEATQASSSSEGSANHRPAGLPFPCLSQAEATHLARLSNHVAPTRRAIADGSILLSTHPLRELAALITFARFCEPLGIMQRV
ncbi:MAG TPA: hypothetical protein VFU69_13755 [Ktedonobacterales bacterium]|nr:hypothetical protein [Ktedonobacterales bacterium]